MNKTALSIADTFNLNVDKSITVTGLSEPMEYTPTYAYSDSYYFRKDLLRDIIAWWEFAPRGEGFYLTGPKGCGKSSLVLQFLARLNWPCIAVTPHEHMELSDLVGRPIVQADGSMAFQYGPLAEAARNGWVLLINELDAFDPSVSIGLNGVVEGEPLVIPENGGEIIYPHPDFRIAATGNTKGDGDEGFYFGTNSQNAAFMDRFWAVNVDYMEKEAEMEILKDKVSYDDAVIEKMVDFANDVRRQYIEGDIDATMSTRVLIRFAQMTEYFYDVTKEDQNHFQYALFRAHFFLATPRVQAAIKELAQRYFGD